MVCDCIRSDGWMPHKADPCGVKVKVRDGSVLVSPCDGRLTGVFRPETR